jgi:hypothetical protein
LNRVGEIVEIGSYQDSDNKNSYFAAVKLGFELVKIEEKGRENKDGTWADFAHFELKKNEHN